MRPGRGEGGKKMIRTAFISSTKIDLVRHREAVRDALLKNAYHPVEMEDFGARDVDPVTGCLRLVGESQVFIGIYAWRYGYVPAGAERSITAEELEQARRLGKPCLCFVVDEHYAWPADPAVPEESPASREALKAFKSSLPRMTASFTTPEQLALMVVTALHRWEQEQAVASVPERRRLLNLMDQVERFWIRSVLERTIPESGLLGRDREARLDEVAQPWEVPSWTERAEPALLPQRTPLDLFVERPWRLLILGEGGHGKTTDLLQLAAGLLALANDPEQPVPVVLKLASWGWRSRHLAAWMSGQIATHYKNLDAAVVRGWIDGARPLLLPLLDGLDEVDPGCREACARAINEFLAGHPACGLAVTCRTDVNEEFEQRLGLRDAYALRPLSSEALDRVLAGGWPGVEALRAALAAPGWRELARTPLLLVMMERVLRRTGAAALGSTPLAEAGKPADAAEARRQVLSLYVREMLERPPQPLRFPLARTRRSLAWLAGQILAHRLAVFQLEELQPSWLAGPARVWLYAVVSRALGGALLVLPVAALGYPILVPVGLAAGACAGVVDGRRLRRGGAGAGPVAVASAAAGGDMAAGRTGVAAAAGTAGAAGQPEPLAHRPAARVLAIGGAAMLCFALIAGLPRLAVGDLVWRLDLADALKFGSACGALFGLVFGQRDIEISFGLARTRWSWSKSRRGAAWPLALVLLWWLPELLRSAIGVYSRFAGVVGLEFFLLMGLVASAVGGLLGGLLGDVEEEQAVPRHRRPGPRQALKVAFQVGWRVLLGAAGALGMVVLLQQRLAGAGFQASSWLATAFAALALGFWIALALRGLDVVQHYTLRVLLWAEGTFPLRWGRFLDQAVDCNLMHRVGSGYEFIHPWLLAEIAGGGAHETAAGDAVGADPA
jgi:eukaryotic-like serine/threonine-protein kinase